MKMTGKELIDWVKENNLENSHVYMHINEEKVVKSVSKNQLMVDECGDILISNNQCITSLTEDELQIFVKGLQNNRLELRSLILDNRPDLEGEELNNLIRDFENDYLSLRDFVVQALESKTKKK